MDNLKTFLATIPNENRDQFDIALDRISNESGVRVGSRLSYIQPSDKNTIYEVSLSDNELTIMKLSCPGVYTRYNRKNGVITFIEEKE